MFKFGGRLPLQPNIIWFLVNKGFNTSGASRPLPLLTKELEYRAREGQAPRIYFRNDKSLFADFSKIIFSIINEYYNEASQTPLKTGAIISYQSFGDLMRANPHWHAIILEGGIDCYGKFHSIPIKNTSNLTQLFRRRVIRYFVNKKLLNEKFASNLLSWKHSGFSVDYAN